MDTSDFLLHAADERHFELTVWPQRPGHAWHAEVTSQGAGTPLRFERPIDLLLYLTEFAGAASPRPPGLR